jgi:hypothetical protein
MTSKVFAGLVLLLIAFAFQFSLAAANVYIDLSFAALIAFAFVFGFWELVFFVLVGVFVINWQPAASPEILIYALFPFVVHFLRDAFHSQPWFLNLVAIFLGFLALAVVVAPAAFPASWQLFLLDLAGSWLFGTCVFFLLCRWGRD